jgi:hypothetical protein
MVSSISIALNMITYNLRSTNNRSFFMLDFRIDGNNENKM